ncbi:MAG: PQQ-binding-like beta-propeller repeat protein [Verrucomicrobiota bacterium]
MIRRQLNTALAVACGVHALLAVVSAENWPQYRGPQGNGTSSDGIAPWPAPGPKPLWKTQLPAGFSSITIADGRAYTLVAREIEGVNREVCLSVDSATGKELWATPLGIAKYDGGGDSGTPENKGGDGPRSTPTVDGGRVYVLDNRLVLFCLGSQDGKVIWSKDLVKEHDGKLISWQNAASPLIEGNVVCVAGGGPGQALLGINKTDGKVIWKREDDKMTHATPVAATILGVRQVIFFTQKGLASVVPQTGEVLWRYRFPYNVSSAASPVVWNDLVYCSAGYNVGSGAVRITSQNGGFSAEEVWRVKGNTLANHWSTPVCKDGYLYGVFGFKQYGTAPLKCVEIATGKELWSQPNFGAGNVILIGNHLVALGDQGQVALVEPSPAGYREVSRFQAISGKCWSTPSYSNGKLFIRSTKEGACYQTAAVNTATRGQKAGGLQ